MIGVQERLTVLIASRHRLELMRHIYNGGGESSGSFDKDEAWSSVMEAGAEPGRAPRLVQTLTPVLPDTMCVPAVSSPRRAASLSNTTHCLPHAACFYLELLSHSWTFEHFTLILTCILLFTYTYSIHASPPISYQYTIHHIQTDIRYLHFPDTFTGTIFQSINIVF